MARRVPLATPESSPLPAAWIVAVLPSPMLFALVAQILASAASVPEHAPARDSVRLVRRAHAEQSDFELLHRAYLPTGYGGGGSQFCDARVGRFCYWSGDGDDDDEKRPDESPRVVRARQRLLASLDSIAAIVPGDAWVAGQRVRYRLDAGDSAGAVRDARSCGARTWWCSALAGLALHESGDATGADSAFDAALATMPDSDRCRWSDISILLDGRLSDRYRKLGCAARDSVADRLWWLSAPLYLVGARDMRDEMLSRVTHARIEQDARTIQSSWGDDLRELMLRYGWSTWYSRVMPPPGSMADPSVVGHDPSPSFDFLPANVAVDSPFTVGPDAFDFRLPSARVRYAPRYLRSIHALPHQLTVFRRGDSALVVAAFDVQGDTTLAGRALAAGLFLWTGPRDGTRFVRDDSATHGVLTATAPWKPLLIGVEVLARRERAAARVRVGSELPPRTGGVAVSDLLLYAPADSAPQRLADVLPAVLASTRIRRRDPLGVFWETYGLAPAGEVVGVSLTITRVQEGWFRRAAEALRIAHRGTPLSVRWQEKPEPGTGIASRGVSVDLSRLPAGRYRVELTLTPDGRKPVVAARALELLN